jgi:hypothetical protein
LHFLEDALFFQEVVESCLIGRIAAAL